MHRGDPVDWLENMSEMMTVYCCRYCSRENDPGGVAVGDCETFAEGQRAYF